MARTFDDMYLFPEEIDAEVPWSISLSALLDREDDQPFFKLPELQPPSEDDVSVHWQLEPHQFNFQDDSPEDPSADEIFLVEDQQDDIHRQLEIPPEADLNHSILNTTELNDKLRGAQQDIPERILSSSVERQSAYISDLLRQQENLYCEDKPFEPVKAPRKDRTIKAICSMIKSWAVAIGQQEKQSETAVSDLFFDLKGCRDIDGIRRALARQERKWLLDRLRTLLDDTTFLFYAITENPHITEQDKTLLWEKLPALRAIVAVPEKIVGSWDPKRIDRSGNFDEALKMISSGKATLERLTEVVNNQYELTKHLFDEVKCSKKNNIYNFWNNAVMKALRQLKKQTINKLLAKEAEDALAKLKGNRSLQGIITAIQDQTTLKCHLQSLHESFRLVELLLQERTNTQMMKSLLDTYSTVVKKLLDA